MALLAIIFSVGIFNSCTEEQDLKSLPYLFRPINFSATLNSTLVTINWAKVDSAASYTLVVSTDSVNFTNPVIQVTIDSISFVKELAGNTTFFAKIRANASDTTRTSKFNSTLRFKTPKENIFLGYGTNINTQQLFSAYMTAVNSLTVKWKAGANVTRLALTTSDGATSDTLDISPSEASAGSKLVSGLVNSKWKVEIFNDKILRGTTYGIVEGDIILNDGDNLQAALTAATSGQVILLAGTGNYSTGSGTILFNSSVKLRGLSSTQLPIVSMKTGATGTANMFGIPTGVNIDSLVFENVNFTGYCDNLPTNTKIGYLFNNKVQCLVTNIKFSNCNIHNFANTVFRLSGGTTAGGNHISNLNFNGCLMNDVGTGYAIVNIGKSYDYIDNITFANSTISKFDYPLISIVQTAILPTPINSIKVTNCTFNQSTQSTATKALFTFDFVNITSGITISKCVFGSSGSISAGLKATNATTAPIVNITGCYYTADFVDETPIATIPYSIKSKMTPYLGKSTDLWLDPITVSTTTPITGGSFKLKDAAFVGKGVAGDLRWY